MAMWVFIFIFVANIEEDTSCFCVFNRYTYSFILLQSDGARMTDENRLSSIDLPNANTRFFQNVIVLGWFSNNSLFHRLWSIRVIFRDENHQFPFTPCQKIIRSIQLWILVQLYIQDLNWGILRVNGISVLRNQVVPDHLFLVTPFTQSLISKMENACCMNLKSIYLIVKS